MKKFITMKRNLWIIGIALVIFSCQQEDSLIKHEDGNVKLTLDLGIETSDLGRIMADNPSTPNPEDFSVTVVEVLDDGSENEIVSYAPFSTNPTGDLISLPVNTVYPYTIRASFNESVSMPSLNQPFYFGEVNSVFVNPGEVTDLVLDIGIQNAGVSFEYEPTVTENFASYSATVTQNTDQLSYGNSDDIIGYFNPGELTISVELQPQVGEIETLTATVPGVAGFHYQVTVNALPGQGTRLDFNIIPLTIDQVFLNDADVSPQQRLNAGETVASLISEGVAIDDLYGLSYAGGLILHVYSDGSGIVAAENDLGDTFRWTPYTSNTPSSLVSGADNLAIDGGLQNTSDIHIEYGGGGSTYAARQCISYTDNGYNDWYLPSRDELNLMGPNLVANGVGGLQLNSYYWSSTESSSYNAYRVFFYEGGGVGNSSTANKTTEYRVRPVRNFEE